MKEFNFRHVAHRVGIPSSTPVNWALGHILSAFAAGRNVEPHLILTEKTNPFPSVEAPHCIAHYPVDMFDDACAVARNWWGDRNRQQDMFD